MKAIKCEMCDSSDIVKQDGMYICQCCGTKYTVEEAKKLMVEGAVSIQGAVKIDNTETVEKSLQNARRAKEKEDWEEAEKYYNIVEENDPSNIEAIFYSSYAKAKASLVVEDIYKRQAIFKALNNSISIVDDNFSTDNIDEEYKMIVQIGEDIQKLFVSSYVYSYKHNLDGEVTWSNSSETKVLFDCLGKQYCLSVDNIAKKLTKDDSIRFYELEHGFSKWLIQNSHQNDIRQWAIGNRDRCAKTLFPEIPKYKINNEFEGKREELNKRINKEYEAIDGLEKARKAVYFVIVLGIIFAIVFLGVKIGEKFLGTVFLVFTIFGIIAIVITRIYYKQKIEDHDAIKRRLKNELNELEKNYKDDNKPSMDR